MSEGFSIERPVLASHARYRWDKIRNQHQLMYPEGVLVLNEAGAAIVQHCDGRTLDELVTALASQFEVDPRADVVAFLARLLEKGLIREADAP